MDPLSAQEAFIIAKKIVRLAVALDAIAVASTLFAQEGTKPANVGQGTVMVKGKNYPLRNALAYEFTIDGEEGIAVVLSGPTISSEKVTRSAMLPAKSTRPVCLAAEAWISLVLRRNTRESR